MRVASLHMTNRYLNQLNRSYELQTKLMEQGDGDKIHRPSDNPIWYSKYLRYSNSKGQNDQYQTNVKTAISWMRNTDGALVDMSEQLKTLVVKSNQAQDTMTDDDMKLLSREMKVLVDQVVSDANTNVSGRYLFSGQKDLVQPYLTSPEKVNRGLTKTMDDHQTSFFNDANLSGDIRQMLVLEGDDDREYYLNTLTGNIYSKDFVDEGYKQRIVMGHENVEAGDEVGKVASTAYTITANYVDSTGAVVAMPASDPKVFEVTDVNGTTFYANETTGAITATAAEQFQATATPGASFDANGNLNAAGNAGIVVDNLYTGAVKVSDHFDKYGVIRDGVTDEPDSRPGSLANAGLNWTTSINVDGKTVNLKFDYINQNIIKYRGDDKHWSMVREPGKTYSEIAQAKTTDIVNANGQDIAGFTIFDDENSGNAVSGAAAFNDALTVVAKAEEGDCARWMSSDGKALANNSFNMVNLAQARLASRQQSYSDCQNMLQTQNETITQDITDVHSADIAQLSVALMQAQTIYNLSLSIGSRIIPPSLADYL